MPGLPTDDEDNSPKKNSGSARTSKKSKRRNVIRYMDWSAEQNSVDTDSTAVQQQAQDIEYTDGSSPEVAEYAKLAIASGVSPGSPTSMERQTEVASLDSFATAAEFISLPAGQCKDASSTDSYLSAPSKQTEDEPALQEDKKEQKADDLPSENMRPNAQNLRYGGYPTQPAPQHRSTPLGSGRLQSTSKIGMLKLPRSCVVE